MQITLLKETELTEKRVALVPAGVSKYIELGFKVVVQSGAGLKAGFTDEDYRKAGAIIARDFKEAVLNSSIIVKVRSFDNKEISKISALAKAILIANFEGNVTDNIIRNLDKSGLTAFALERMPRISRTQGMDVLSSQSNLAGYRAVVDAFYYVQKTVPMMMTSAGTISPAKVLILGIGVAGLQAIATAKRMGAVVYASDIRSETKEQAESLGAKFIHSDEFISNLEMFDVIITTAVVLGKKPPLLIDEKAVKKIKKGAVVIDMAASGFGGNVFGVKAFDKTELNGVLFIGNDSLAEEVAYDASILLARNYLNFITPMVKNRSISIDFSDEIYKQTCIADYFNS